MLRHFDAWSERVPILFYQVLACLFSFLPVTVAVIFCGHLGTVELNAIGLAAAVGSQNDNLTVDSLAALY